MSLVSAWPDYFHQLAQHDRYVLVERKFFASGQARPDLITIKEAARDITWQHRGMSSGQLALPEEVFAYFVENGMIFRDNLADGENQATYRLTADAHQIASQLVSAAA